MLNQVSKKHHFNKQNVQIFLNCHTNRLRLRNSTIDYFEISDELWDAVAKNHMTEWLFEQIASVDVLYDSVDNSSGDAHHMTRDDMNDNSEYLPYTLIDRKARELRSVVENTQNHLVAIMYHWFLFFDAEKHKEMWETGEGKEWMLDRINDAERDIIKKCL